MFHYIYCKSLLLRRRIANRLFYTKLYETRFGVKYFMPIFDPVFPDFGDIFFAKPNELYLDFDALKDEYTLCDVSIIDSPHLELMRAIDCNKDLRKTDYIKRFENGTLDIRIPHHVTNNDIIRFIEKFKAKKTEIQTLQYKPVTVYKVGENYYIADGKHRAAMCAMMGVDVRCRIINNHYLEDSFYQWILKRMLQNPRQYKKNILFFERLNKK